MLILSNPSKTNEMKCLCWAEPSDSRLSAEDEDNIYLSLDQTKNFKLELKKSKDEYRKLRKTAIIEGYQQKLERECNLHI